MAGKRESVRGRCRELAFELGAVSLLFLSGCFSEPWPPWEGDSYFQGLLLHFPEVAFKGVVFEAERTELRVQFGLLSSNAAVAAVDVRGGAPEERTLRLTAVDGPDYAIDSRLIPSNFYRPGRPFVFSASVAGALFEATVRAPEQSDAVDLDPEEPAVSEAYPGMKKHPRATELRLHWPEALGRRALVSVVRGVVSSTLTPELVSREPGYALGPGFSLVASQAAKTTMTIPASVFAEDGPYAVIVTLFESQPEKARDGTIWSIIVGHAYGLTLAVGDYAP